jgi:predicted phosphodiesterase
MNRLNSSRFWQSRKSTLLFYALILGAMTLAVAVAQARTEFKFVVLADSQFHNPAIFERMVREVDLLKPALVVQVGDLINGYQYDEKDLRAEWVRFKKQIAPLSMPYYPVPGNHDVTTTQAIKVYAEVWGNDRFFYSFDHANSHFIVLDAYHNLQYDTVGEEQIKFLKDDLATHAHADNIFVFIHAPFDLDASSGWDKIHALLRQYPVRIVFSGHIHTYNFHTEDGIRYINFNSSGLMNYNYFELGMGFEFLVVSVQDKDATVAIIKGGSVYAEDLASSTSRQRAATYLSLNQVIRIPAPLAPRTKLVRSFLGQGWMKFHVPITLENRTDDERSYVLDWTVPDERWTVEPLKKRFTVAPHAKRDIMIRLRAPRGTLLPQDFPYATVSTPYATNEGKTLLLTHTYSFMVPRHAVASRLSAPLVLDGRLDEPAWKGALPFTDFQLDKPGTLSPDLTVARILYDDQYLYVGIWGFEPNPAGMRAGAAGPIPFVFGDDSFQLFFDTGHFAGQFFRFMSNSKGTILSSGPKGLNKYHLDVRTDVGKDYWAAEFRISFKEMEIPPPRQGDTWGLNIRRARYQSSVPNSNWAAMDEWPYEPQRFGILTFK